MPNNNALQELFGPIYPMWTDDNVIEIMINGFDAVFVERHDNQLQRVDGVFTNNSQVREIIDKLLVPLGLRVDESHPIVDGRFPDGSRMHIVIPPIATTGPTLVIRKLDRRPLTVQNLLEYGAWSEDMVAFLRACVEGTLNIIVAGGVGAGKTTVFQLLLDMIPSGERLIVVEHMFELQFEHDHMVRLEARPANLEGKGEISVTQLMLSALKMRPDRIILNEARGGEVLHFLQAINTGINGSITGMHAANLQDALNRLEVMALMADPSVPLLTLRQQLANALDLILMVERDHQGQRRVVKISEVTGLRGDAIVLQDIFAYDSKDGFIATGTIPSFLHWMLEKGVNISPDLFKV